MYKLLKILSTTHRQRRGFTLLEMVITVSIIGILAALVAPTYLENQAQAKFVVSKSNLLTIKTAFSNYFFRSVFAGRGGEYVPEPGDNNITTSWAASTTLYDGSTVQELFSGHEIIYNPNGNPYQYFILPDTSGFQLTDSDFGLEVSFRP